MHEKDSRHKRLKNKETKSRWTQAFSFSSRVWSEAEKVLKEFFMGSCIDSFKDYLSSTCCR